MRPGARGEECRQVDASTISHIVQKHNQMQGYRPPHPEVGGVCQLSHGGGTNSQTSLLVLQPAHQFALAILTNRDGARRFTQVVRRFALRGYLHLDDRQPRAIESTPANLAPYAGHCSSFFTDADLGLVGQAGGPDHLQARLSQRRHAAYVRRPLRARPPARPRRRFQGYTG